MCSTSLTSIAIVTRTFLAPLHASKNPKVINITSGLGSIHNTLSRKMVRFLPYRASKIGMNGTTVHMQTAENDRVQAEDKDKHDHKSKIRFYVVTPKVLKTSFTNHIARGKDAFEGAEAAKKIALDCGNEFASGTNWEFEEDMMRRVPW